MALLSNLTKNFVKLRIISGVLSKKFVTTKYSRLFGKTNVNYIKIEILVLFYSVELGFICKLISVKIIPTQMYEFFYNLLAVLAKLHSA